VYSWEDPKLKGSELHDVFFQWWRYQSAGHTFVPEPPVRVFDSPSSRTAYTRALMARDSWGRFWVQAFKLESKGASRAVISVSTDGGRTFAEQPALDVVPRRGGGRLQHLNDRLLFVYAMHDGGEPTRMRVRMDSAPVSDWSPVQAAFPEGIYHGAALSAVNAPDGTMHLVYKDEHDILCHRRFDGTAFGPRTELAPGGDWAVQSAVTLRGNRLFVFYNQPEGGEDYALYLRTLENGVFSEPVLLDDSSHYKGYLAAVDQLPRSSSSVPCFYGQRVDGGRVRQLSLLHLPVTPEVP
jgi:hypothetical protein